MKKKEGGAKLDEKGEINMLILILLSVFQEFFFSKKSPNIQPIIITTIYISLTSHQLKFNNLWFILTGSLPSFLLPYYHPHLFTFFNLFQTHMPASPLFKICFGREKIHFDWEDILWVMLLILVDTNLGILCRGLQVDSGMKKELERCYERVLERRISRRKGGKMRRQGKEEEDEVW